jgi:hypothetical protein
LVEGLSLAILKQTQEASLRFDQALQILEAHGEVQLVRGASVPLARTRQLTRLWLQSPPLPICSES